MSLARSTYYAKPKVTPQADAALRSKIEGICGEFPGYGYRRVTHELRDRNIVVNHKKVMRLMREEGFRISTMRVHQPSAYHTTA